MIITCKQFKFIDGVDFTVYSLLEDYLMPNSYIFSQVIMISSKN